MSPTDPHRHVYTVSQNVLDDDDVSLSVCLPVSQCLSQEALTHLKTLFLTETKLFYSQNH